MSSMEESGQKTKWAGFRQEPLQAQMDQEANSLEITVFVKSDGATPSSQLKEFLCSGSLEE